MNRRAREEEIDWDKQPEGWGFTTTGGGLYWLG